MAYEKIVSVPSTAASGQVPQADGVGGFSWGAVDTYTKAQTLTEATKIAYGLDASAVPDDALAVLSRFYSGIGNEHIWEKYKPVKTLVIDEYTTRNIDGAFSTAGDIHMVYYADTIDDNLNLVNQSSISLSYNNASTYTSTLAGKYWKYGGTLYYGNESATVLRGQNANGTYYLKVSNSARVRAIIYNHTEVSYVNSMDAAAYPPAVSDGYTYDYLGQLGEKTRIATGSYTGTGTYGSSNPTSLTFDFVPQFVFIQCMGDNEIGCFYPSSMSNAYVTGAGIVVDGNSNYTLYTKMAGTTLSWYGTNNQEGQLNRNKTYRYTAIG